MNEEANKRFRLMQVTPIKEGLSRFGTKNRSKSIYFANKTYIHINKI